MFMYGCIDINFRQVLKRYQQISNVRAWFLAKFLYALYIVLKVFMGTSGCAHC